MCLYILLFLYCSYILLCFSFFLRLLLLRPETHRIPSFVISFDIPGAMLQDVGMSTDTVQIKQPKMGWFTTEWTNESWPQISMLIGEYPSLSLFFLASQSNSMVDKQGKWTAQGIFSVAVSAALRGTCVADWVCRAMRAMYGMIL